jgi:hypothetical protein
LTAAGAAEIGPLADPARGELRMRAQPPPRTIGGEMTVQIHSQMRLCRLQQVASIVEACPEERCPFWEPGGAVVEGRCAFDAVDVSRNPELAGWLLQIRRRLESARSQEEEMEAHRLLHQLVNSSDE